MALILSTGFEGPWSNTDTSTEIFGPVTVKQILNTLYFKRCPIHTVNNHIHGATNHPSMSQGGAGSTGIQYGLLDNVAGTTTVNGRGTVFGSRNTTNTGTIILSGTSFPNGFYCSYNTYMRTDVITSKGVYPFAIMNHNDTVYWLMWRTSRLNAPPPGDEGSLAIIAVGTGTKNWYDPGVTFTAVNNSGNANLGNETPIVKLREVNEIKFGITPAGVIKFRMNDIETQHNTGVSWVPALSDFIGFCGMAPNVGAISSDTTIVNSIDDLTIQDSLSGIDDDLPPIYIGKNIGKYQDVGPNLTSGSLIVGECYEIVTQSTLDFTTIGAADNNPGTIFRSKGTGPLGAGDEVKVRPCSVELVTPNSALPVGLNADDTNAHVLFDYDNTTYSKFDPQDEFNVNFPTMSAVSTLSAIAGSSAFINISMRNLGIDTASNMQAKLTISSGEISETFTVPSPETYANLFIPYRSTGPAVHLNRTDYETATGSIIRP